MLKLVYSMTAAALWMGLASTAASAMPLGPVAAQAGAPPVELVRDGCGPYGHRNRYGECRPNDVDIDGIHPMRHGYGVVVPGYGAIGVYDRHCFIRETYDGPRRICRD